VVTETERRVDYVSSFGDRSDAPQLEATGLVAHQSLNYLAFTFNVHTDADNTHTHTQPYTRHTTHTTQIRCYRLQKSPKPDGVPSLQVGTRVCFYSLMPRYAPNPPTID
jgi:hypothetical protein